MISFSRCSMRPPLTCFKMAKRRASCSWVMQARRFASSLQHLFSDTKNTIIIPVIINHRRHVMRRRHNFIPITELGCYARRIRSLGSAPNVNDWAGTLPEFRAQLLENVRAGSVDAALPNFSTSDAITSAAFTCSLMRALQNFFTCASSAIFTLLLPSNPINHPCIATTYLTNEQGTNVAPCAAFPR